jgi:RNA polymerase sigma factor (sigma-70 family)
VTDKELLTSIATKNQKAYNAFYNRYKRLFYDLSFSQTHDKVIADEINQIFWIAIWVNPTTIKTDSNDSAKSFLYKHFSFCMLDYLKSAAARQTGGTEDLLDLKAQEMSYSHVLEEMEVQEVLTLMDRVVADMPELSREVYQYRWKEGLSTAETAQQLGVTEQTVRIRYNAALNSIKKQIQPLYPSRAFSAITFALYLSTLK